MKDKVVGIFEGRKVGVNHRLIFVHSTAKAKQQAATRERHLEKIRAEFVQVEKILGKYSLKTEAAIRAGWIKPAASTAKASCSPTR